MTFFIDSCLGTGIKQHLIDMGLDAVLHDEMFAQGTPDTDWITGIAAKGWPVLTRDRNIKRRRLTLQAIIEGPLKFFSIGSGQADLPTLVQVVRNNLGSIAALVLHMPAPFVVTLTLQDLKFKWLGDSPISSIGSSMGVMDGTSRRQQQHPGA